MEDGGEVGLDIGGLFAAEPTPTKHTFVFPVTTAFAEGLSALQLPRDSDASEPIIDVRDGELVVRLCSRGTSADAAASGGDLTGYTIYPETTMLATFLIAHAAKCFRGKTMIEVGAGLALGAHVAVACGAACPVVASDGCGDVLRLIRHPAVQPLQLVWGPDEVPSEMRHQFDVCFGSGIAYSNRTLPALLETARQLLRHPPSAARFVVGFRPRQVSAECLFEATSRAGFELLNAPEAADLATTAEFRGCRDESGVAVYVFALKSALSS